ASRLRKFSGFGCLDSLGFPWILSTEMSLFKGLRASLREFFSRSDLSPRKEPLPDERPIEPLRFAWRQHEGTIQGFLLFRNKMSRTSALPAARRRATFSKVALAIPGGSHGRKRQAVPLLRLRRVRDVSRRAAPQAEPPERRGQNPGGL